MFQKISLPDRRLAAALMAIGVPRTAFRVDALHHTGTREKRTAWHLESDQAQAIQQDLDHCREDHPKALWRAEPNCPLLVALTAIHNHGRLTAWMAGKRPPQGMIHSRGEGSLTYRLEDHSASSLPCFTPRHAIRDLVMASAFVTCGFALSPAIEPGGLFGFASESTAFPDLLPHMALAAVNQMRDEKTITLPELPGYPPGQHPFCYAFGAANNLRHLPALEEAAWKYPTHFFKGTAGTAFANEAALKNNAFHRALQPHLTGV